MATFNKFETFVGDVGKKVHDLDADMLMVYLTNNLPDTAADSVKADLVGITEENGYTAADITNTWSETTGTGTLGGTDVEWTATTGGFGPFQYVVLYNDTPTAPADPLVAWWDYGSSISCGDGEKFTVDFGTSILTLA